MKESELVHWLYRHAKTGMVNHQEGIAIREAADTIVSLRAQVTELTAKLEDAEERVAIMMEGNGISEEQLEMRTQKRGGGP